MSEDTGKHTYHETREVNDMPIADPETYEFLGRYDTIWCVECEEIVSKKLREDNG